ncbi:MAG TPA: tetratricopeptide repeat protein [Flavitalea sp.]|nr:tetratricopeptide repeat protein [Flavitalea sp.]
MGTSRRCYSQPALDYEEWTDLLSSTKDNSNKAFKKLFHIYAQDSSASIDFYNELEKRNLHPNDYFKSRVHTLKLHKTIALHQYSSKPEIILLAQEAVAEAYETDDEYLIAFISFECGGLLSNLGELERAATYLLKGQEMLDRLGGQTIRDQYMNYSILGETLFHCREYQKSIFYTRRAINIYNDTVYNADLFRTRFYNTVGQNYMKLEMPDSAMAYFDTSLQFANKMNDDVWRGINSGFIGQVLFQQKRVTEARPFLEIAYVTNRNHERDHAGKALQLLARIDLEQGKIDSARLKCNEALAILKPLGQTYYLQAASFLELAYHTSADIFMSAGMTDSFYHYNRLYTNLRDSIQNVTLLSGTKIAQLRIDNENNYRAVQLLKREKRNNDMKRNFLIIAILLVSAIVFLYIKRMQLKQRHKEELVVKEKHAAEAELLAAKEQMKLFTENIIEKTDLIDKLKQQILNKELSAEQRLVVDEITHHTILTEAEWEHFKSLFEKIHPGFFNRLKERAHDVTVAEQRMAALTRMNLTARQMASILGISVDSVHKTRQRLRQRLHVPAEVNLEQSVAAF